MMDTDYNYADIGNIEDLDNMLMDLFQRIIEHDATDDEIAFARNIYQDLHDLFTED